MNDEIVEFLTQNGEKTTPEMAFPHLTRATLNGKLRNLFERGKIDRRMVTTHRGDMWAYTAIYKPNRPNQFKNEPDVVYFLRNLPREEFLEESIDILEAAL
jgi:predicted transcriptional regulator